MPSRFESQAAFNDEVGNDNCVHSPVLFEEPLNPGQRERLAEEHIEHLPLGDGNHKPDNNEPDEDTNNNNDSVSDYDTHAATSTRQKRVRSNTSDTDYNSDSTDTPTRARKLVKSRGKPKAGDYTDDVQDVLEKAITHFKVDLLRLNPYPDHTQELTWAKTSWAAANKLCDLNIMHNTELIKLVSLLVLRVR